MSPECLGAMFAAGCAWGILCMLVPYRQVKRFWRDADQRSERWRDRCYELSAAARRASGATESAAPGDEQR